MVIINGAGIAGLTLANALELQKMDYVLIEKASEFRALGAGIILQNNGLAILDKLNLSEDINAFDVVNATIGNNHRVNSVNAKALGVKCKVIHRAELQKLLLKKLDHSKIKLNTSIAKYEIQQDSVCVTLSDQTKLNGDFLIDASGINSDLFDAPELLDTQLWCWRSIVNLKSKIDNSGEYWFGKNRLGFAPISDTQAYIFHVIKLNKNESESDFSRFKREQWIKSKAQIIPQLDEVMFDDQNWLSHPLQDRVINWGKGRLIKIGDSAHAMTPNLGQGAVLSMEDAFLLALILKNNPVDALSQLTKSRHKRIKSMHTLSRQMGWFAHTDSLFFNGIKWLMFKIMPLKYSIKKQLVWMDAFVNKIEGEKI